LGKRVAPNDAHNFSLLGWNLWNDGESPTVSVDASIALVERTSDPYEVHAIFMRACESAGYRLLHLKEPISKTLPLLLIREKLRALANTEKAKP
jgi:hypothetical protein